MPWEIIRDNIADLHVPVEVVVNLPHPVPGKIGTGVDQAIHKKAGPMLLRALEQHGVLNEGDPVYTDGYELTNAYGDKVNGIIHVRGPLWRNGIYEEEETLRKCYDRALEMASGRGFHSIAFPLISSGNRDFAIKIAYRISNVYFRYFCDSEPQIHFYLVVLDKESFDYCKRQQAAIPERVDEHSAQEVLAGAYSRYGRPAPAEATYQSMLDTFNDSIGMSERITQVLNQADGENVFTILERLVKLVSGQANMKVAEICRRGNLDERHFSNNIRSKASCNPEKKSIPRNTLLAYAVALNLNLRQTEKLMEHGGYKFPHNESDRIVQSYMEKKVYDIDQINDMLIKEHLRPLGRAEDK